MTKLVDTLLSEGLEVEGFVVKAQLKVPVRPAHLPAVQDLVDGAMSVITTQYEKMLASIAAVLRGADARKAIGLYILPSGDDLIKATNPPKQPVTNRSGQMRAKPGEAAARDYKREKTTAAQAGSRGGKWYLDSKGNVRYGEKPTHIDSRELTPEEVPQHLSALRPSPFMGVPGVGDRRLIGHLLKNIKKAGFTEYEGSLLEAWFGSIDDDTGEAEDGFVNHFLDMYGEHMDTLGGDLSGEFSHPEIQGGRPLTYQEAVMEFWKMQEISTDDGSPMEDGDLEALLLSIHKKFEQYKKNPAVAALVEQSAKEYTQRRAETLAFKIQDTEDLVAKLGDIITSEADPSKRNQKLVAALSALNLVYVPQKGNAGKSAASKGLVVPNNAYFNESKSSPGLLLSDPSYLQSMSSSQLMAVVVGARLAAAWDPEAQTYDAYTVPRSKVEDVALAQLKRSLRGLDDTGLSVLSKQIDDATSNLAEKLNDANTGKDSVFKEFVRQGDDLLRDESKAGDLIKRFEEWNELRDASLKAQQDDAFTLPKKMAAGMLGKGGQELFRHQKQAINWMSTVKRGVLALDAGMGKTRTVITAMEKWKQEGKVKSAILFLPPSLMSQWPNDIAEVAPHLTAPGKILNLAGLSLEDRKIALADPSAKNAEYILISTGTLNGGGEKDELDEHGNDGTGGSDNEMIELLKGLDGAMFIDEVHQGGYKSADTVRHKIAREVLGEREYAFGMTATPMPNSPMDLFNLTDLFAPGSVGTREEWEGRLHGVQYDSDLDKWDVANPQHLVELRNRLQPFVMYRAITDDEVKSDPAFAKLLPADPIQENKHIEVGVDHPMYQYLRTGGIIDDIVESRLDAIDEERVAKGKEPHGERARALLARLLSVNLHKQACISPALIDDEYKGPAPKLDRMVADIVDHFKGGGGTEDAPLVIFSSYPGRAFPLLRKMLAEAGIPPSVVGEIHGGKTSTERGFEQDMTNQGKRKVLLVGTQSGGAGLNLQKKAYRSKFLDEPWHPSAKRQAQGRVWRVGQKRQTFIDNYRITLPDAQSWDEKTSDKIGGKQAMVAAMLLPNVDLGDPAFSDAIEQSVLNLQGVSTKDTAAARRRKGTPDGHRRAARLSRDDIYGEEFKNVDTGESGDEVTDIDEHFDNAYDKYHDKKKHRELMKVAPHLATEFAEGEARAGYNQTMRFNNAKQAFSVNETKLRVAETSGDTDKKEKVLRAMHKLTAMYRAHAGQLAVEAKVLHKQGDKAAVKERQDIIKKMESAFPEAFSKQWLVSTPEKPEAKKPEAKKPEAKKPEAKKPEAKKPQAKVLAHSENPFKDKKDIAHSIWNIIHDAKASNQKAAIAAIRPHIKKLTGHDPKKIDHDDIIEQIMAYMNKKKVWSK